jgi:hypothetical protein
MTTGQSGSGKHATYEIFSPVRKAKKRTTRKANKRPKTLRQKVIEARAVWAERYENDGYNGVMDSHAYVVLDVLDALLK